MPRIHINYSTHVHPAKQKFSWQKHKEINDMKALNKEIIILLPTTEECKSCSSLKQSSKPAGCQCLFIPKPVNRSGLCYTTMACRRPVTKFPLVKSGLLEHDHHLTMLAEASGIPRQSFTSGLDGDAKAHNPEQHQHGLI